MTQLHSSYQKQTVSENDLPHNDRNDFHIMTDHLVTGVAKAVGESVDGVLFDR
jgi:hypothetical protein